MSEKTYYVGDVWEIDCTVERTRTKTAVDPTGLHVLITKPDKTSSTITPTKTATGVYYAAIPLTAHGTWHATWIGSEGTDQGIETITQRVLEAPLTP